MRCPDCNRGTLICGECEICGLTMEDVRDAADYFDGLADDDWYDDEPDQFRDDVEADADALASAGYGTDEDYGWEYGWEG